MNAKRLIHITGQDKIAWKIKRIEIATDPCPLKLSNKEKEKVMSTSKAQSIVSSRKSSRRASFDKEDLSRSRTVDDTTKSKCVQSASAGGRDDPSIENNPGLFAAEQTWPTKEELKKPLRKGSLDHDQMMDIEQEPLDMVQIKPK